MARYKQDCVMRAGLIHFMETMLKFVRFSYARPKKTFWNSKLGDAVAFVTQGGVRFDLQATVFCGLAGTIEEEGLENGTDGDIIKFKSK